MEEVRRITKGGQLVYVVTYGGREFKRYPGGKHPNYYYHKWKKDGKYYMEILHRVIWEDSNGRKIPEGYDIHHKDWNPFNNAPENLQLVTKSEHSQIHNSLARALADGRITPNGYTPENWKDRRAVAMERLAQEVRICKQCGAEFTPTNVHQRFCTKKCHHKWQYTAPELNIKLVCKCCGREFVGNKYLRPKSCSKECAYKLSIVGRGDHLRD